RSVQGGTHVVIKRTYLSTSLSIPLIIMHTICQIVGNPVFPQERFEMSAQEQADTSLIPISPSSQEDESPNVKKIKKIIMTGIITTKITIINKYAYGKMTKTEKPQKQDTNTPQEPLK